MTVCTLALYFNVFDDYPMIVAANRDEHYDRPSAPAARSGRNPVILAGRDLVAGGTWLGVNDHGLLVGILNRRVNQEQTNKSGFRSRGLLCLDLLNLKSAARAAAYLQRRQEAIYQPFTLVLADQTDAWTVANFERRIQIARLDRGLHVFSNTGAHDERFEKSSRAYALFNEVSAKELDGNRTRADGWVARLAKVLSDHNVGGNSDDPRDAICVHGELSGTVSSSVLLYSGAEKQFLMFYCPAPPCRKSFAEPLAITVR